MAEFCCRVVKSCFCCHSCPKTPCTMASSCTKNLYFLIFTFSFLLECLALAMPSVCRALPFCNREITFVCKHYASFVAIYRIALTFAIFFLAMCISTFGISSSRNDRAAVHNGFWFYKILCIGSLLYGTSHIPYGMFDFIFMYIALCCVWTFNTYLLALYCNLASDLGSFCMIFFWRDGSPCIKFVLTFLLLSFFLSALMLGVFLLTVYKSCTINLVLIIVNLLLSYIINLSSIGFKYYQQKMYAVLKGSVLCIHIMCITWSAIANNPRPECNPSPNVSFVSFQISNYVTMFSILIGVVMGQEYFFRKVRKDDPNPAVILEERGTECCGVWGKRSVVRTVQPPNPGTEGTLIYATTDENEDEYDSTKYHWFATHHIFLQGVFYLMFCLSDNYALNWDKMEKGPNQYNEAAMWVKMASSWLCLFLFFLNNFFADRRTGFMFY